MTETHAVETYQNNFKPELSSQTTTSKTSGGYRSSLELKGNYTQINRDAAGLRQGATTGNYWSLTSQETNLSGDNGGPSSVTASWNMDSPNTTVELRETLSSSFNSMMTTENTYTADNGSLTSKSAYADLAWGTSDTKTSINGLLDGSGNQLSGTQTVQNDDESEGTVLADWSEVTGPNVPRTVSNRTEKNTLTSHWTDHRVFLDERSNGFIAGETRLTSKGSSTDTAVGKHKYGQPGAAEPTPVQLPATGGNLIANIPSMTLTPQEMKVNDRTKSDWENNRALTGSITLALGIENGTLYSEDFRGMKTTYSLDHFATRDCEELLSKTNISGSIIAKTTDAIATTVTSGQYARKRLLTVENIEDREMEIDARGEQNRDGWTHTWSFTTKQPTKTRFENDVIKIRPNSTAARTHSDVTVTTEYAENGSAWTETSRKTDAIEGLLARTEFHQTDSKNILNGERRIHDTFLEDESIEYSARKGTPANYTFTIRIDNSRTMTKKPMSNPIIRQQGRVMDSLNPKIALAIPHIWI